MEIITLVIIALSILSIGLGLLFGLFRGFGNSLLRLGLIVVSIIFAFIFKGTLTNFILNYKINDVTIEATIIQSIPEEYRNVSEIIIPILKILAGIIAFLIIFIVLQVITYIVFKILKIFINKIGKKNKLFGLIVGGVQGVLVALTLCVPLSGLINNVNKISNIKVYDNEKKEEVALIDVSQFDESFNLGLNKYPSSFIGKIYIENFDFLFKMLSSTTNSNNETITLDGQIDALVSTVKIANEVMKISNVDFSSGLNANNVSDVTDMLRNLQTIKDSLDDESINTINQLVNTIASNITDEANIDLSDFDLSTINFTTEANIIDEVYKASNSENIDDVDFTNLINNLKDSTLILPLVSSSDVVVDVNATKKEEIKGTIDALSDCDDKTKEDLRKLFNITE